MSRAGQPALLSFIGGASVLQQQLIVTEATTARCHRAVGVNLDSKFGFHGESISSALNGGRFMPIYLLISAGSIAVIRRLGRCWGGDRQRESGSKNNLSDGLHGLAPFCLGKTNFLRATLWRSAASPSIHVEVTIFGPPFTEM